MSDYNSTRRTLLKRGGAAVAGVGVLSGTASAAKDYDYLTPVFTTSDLNVRDGPGTGYGIVATAAKRTGGRVYEGPESADGYNWWKVQFSGDGNNGSVTGWVAEDWLSSANFACPMTGTVTSTYWDTRDDGSRYHRAVDISTGGGAYVHAAEAGTVVYAGWASGYGRLVKVEHPSGWVTAYAHLAEFRVSGGDAVSRGDLVGIEGDSGVGTGPHLHFEVRDTSGAKRRSYYDDNDSAVQGTGVPRVFF
jgi:murein DD-endopeptidase MepM/ murein hydrolase activator NlpD